MHKQVVIIGAGPAGLLLARMLTNRNVDCLIIENRNEPFLRKLYRGGIIESSIVECLVDEKASTHIISNGITLEKISFHIGAEKIELNASFNENQVPSKIYDQRNLVTDMIHSLREDDVPIIFEAKAQRFEGLEDDKVRIVYTLDAQLYDMTCDYVVGCDGFRGISRRSIPQEVRTEYKEELPYGWLEWYSERKQLDQPIVGYSDKGLAMAVPTVDGYTRFYMQVKRGVEKHDLPEDIELWEDIEDRLQISLISDDMKNKKLDYMRSFYTDALQYKRLIIAGDAAHQVPRFGGKGLNMALSDSMLLGNAFGEFYNNDNQELLNNYTKDTLEKNLPIIEYCNLINEIFHQKEETNGTLTEEAILSFLKDPHQNKTFSHFIMGH